MLFTPDTQQFLRYQMPIVSSKDVFAITAIC